MRVPVCAEQPSAAQQEGSTLASDTSPQDEGFDADATPEDLLVTTEVQEEEEELVLMPVAAEAADVDEAEEEEEAVLLPSVPMQDDARQVGPHALAFT